ncbi:universal stress protein [Nocardia flavorosea]|uniref:Universal stress protein n=1 Tax=Nocardia flavorosea TaxID=53429 RepID=A0A846YPH4_9NOCA|nr:universal stress protein [Nocardia flavorosea]NKY58849.1 universal stress protein [Nocardia flavorosea]
MTDNPEDPHRLVSAAVVVGVDGTPAAHSAIRWGATVAARRGRRLVLAYGMNSTPAKTWLVAYQPMVDEAVQTLRTHGEQALTTGVQVVREAAPDLAADTLLSEHSPAKMLIELSKSAHMVVLGSRRGGAIAHLGSTILAVAAHGHGTIVAVREDAEDITSGPVVVGVDGSPVSDTAVAAAFAEASERGAELVAVHTWSDLTFTEFASTGFIEIPAEDLQTAEQAVLAERLAGWQQRYPEVTVRREVYPSTPALHLREWSERAQLVVVGSRGRGGFRGLLLGSTSQSLIQRAACPVMITRPG